MKEIDTCDHHHTIESGGFITCIRCGTCLSQVISDQTPRIFLDKAARVQNSTIPVLDRRQSTLIKIGSSITKLKEFDSTEWLRKIKHNYYYANDCKDTAHKRVFDLVASNLVMGDDKKEMAWILLKHVAKTNGIRGHCLQAMIKACIYVACEIQNSPIFIGELVKKTHDMRKVYICLRTLSSALVTTRYKRKRASLKDLIWRIGNIFGIETPTIIKSVTLARLAISRGFVPLGKKPAMVAGCFLYIASMMDGARLEQSRVSKVVQATEITLRERIKEVLAVLPQQYELAFTDLKTGKRSQQVDGRSQNPKYPGLTTYKQPGEIGQGIMI